jgi:hypothetical protein
MLSHVNFRFNLSLFIDDHPVQPVTPFNLLHQVGQILWGVWRQHRFELKRFFDVLQTTVLNDFIGSVYVIFNLLFPKVVRSFPSFIWRPIDR